jgi:ribonucleoside-diphosphate reductase alpha chain
LPDLFTKSTSSGFVRSKLYVVSNNSGSSQPTSHGSLALQTDDGRTIETRAYLEQKQDQVNVMVGVSVGSNEAAAQSERVRQARAKGYEGEACGECGNFTMVRNGTCLKCDTCGGTSGCS